MTMTYLKHLHLFSLIIFVGFVLSACGKSTLDPEYASVNKYSQIRSDEIANTPQTNDLLLPRRNLALAKYLAENGPDCDYINKEKGLEITYLSSKTIESSELISFFLNRAFCEELQGNYDASVLNMYRVVHMSELFEVGLAEKRIALSFLSQSGFGELVDFGWSNDKMLNDGLSIYGAGDYTDRLSTLKQKQNMKLFRKKIKDISQGGIYD